MARGSIRASKKATADRPGQADPTAPVDGEELLVAARPVLSLLRTDLEQRATDPGVARALEKRYEAEKEKKLTGDSFATWREARVAQIAASWFLSCVFVRTLEDRGLLGQARLAGPGAMDSQTLFFQLAPSLTPRDYLLFVFRELAGLPASRALFDREHALVWQLSPSADAAKELLRLFREPSADAPAFRFGQASTRFLGDLYQDLYEDVRKRFALLQTPDFVESFILDRTLEPAIERFGLDDTTLIDPTCGSGHFLLGAFDRLFEHRLRQTPGIDVRRAAHLSLDAVFGADINPYAVAIARMRLVLAFLEKAGIKKLKDAPALPLHLAVADSLLHNPQHAQLDLEHREGQESAAWRGESFAIEDGPAARDVLHRHYAAVVGNPPYITEKDPVKRETYRAMYPRSAAMQFGLSAPFCERLFQLARSRGYVGQITANSFMKREFGKALIEQYLPTVNLELIVNTAGAYIPGHGTPTVMLLGTHESPGSREVLTVLAKRGEPLTPDEPAKGAVWSSIAVHWNDVAFENDYISVTNIDRGKLTKHPWSLGGGGASELKELVEERCEKCLADVVDEIGFMCMTRADDIYISSRDVLRRHGISDRYIVDSISGETVRDWSIDSSDAAVFPYEHDNDLSVTLDGGVHRYLWPFRTLLWLRREPNGNHKEIGMTWWEWSRFQRARYRRPPSIAFAFVATHNHFAIDRGGRVFNRTAPIIKLAAGASEDDHLELLAYLNSSAACFWMKQVLFEKSSQNYVGDVRDKPERIHYEFAGTALQELPIPVLPTRVVAIARRLCDLAQRRQAVAPAQTIARSRADGTIAQQLASNRAEYERLLRQMVVLQEELDWEVYAALGLADDTLLAMTRGLELGTQQAAPEQRPYLGASDDVDPQLAALWTARRDAAAQVPELALLEQPLFKRPWLGVQGVFHRDGWSYEALSEVAAVEALAERIEHQFADSPEPRTASQIASKLERTDAHGLLRILDPEADSDAMRSRVGALLMGESVPFVAAARLTESGLIRRSEWEAVWELQRREDRGEHVSITAPPKYATKDFRDANYYRLRGQLDVPKERYISYPGCESDADREPVYGWAGWNHLERAQALAALYQKRKTDEGWAADRLTPMLTGILELLPWIEQWHNDVDPEYGLRMGDYFAQFLESQCQELGLTRAQLEGWRPLKRVGKRAKPATTANGNHDAEDEAPRPRKRAKASSGENANGAPAKRRRTRKPVATVDATSATSDPQEEPS